VTATYESAKRIVFHSAGDTGAASPGHIGTEARVADAMTAELAAASGAKAPAFFFHLGDLVYSFGEPQYYYDQFYEPFRAYDAPIFAIPGNHDGFPEEGQSSLFAFLRNFCAIAPGRSPDAGGLVRSTMTQPGVYFTLEAPWVSIIGLYSNVLEGPGVISSEKGAYPVGDQQLEFLTNELKQLKPKREAGECAVVLAVHHPPLAADRRHGGARGLSDDIDRACTAAELWPDLVLSGHAHLYQRFTRTIGEIEVPYVIAGSGGHNVGLPPAGEGLTPPEGFTMPVPPRTDYGYLTITVDMKKGRTMTVQFNSTSPTHPEPDTFTINLNKRKLV
jgi:predicted phosphodiesterase